MLAKKVSLPYQAPLIFSSVASDTLREEGVKDQKKIRLGLIDVGNWALFAHVRVLRLLPEYEIVAVYSQRKEAAKAAATEYGIPHVSTAGCIPSRPIDQFPSTQSRWPCLWNKAAQHGCRDRHPDVDLRVLLEEAA